MSELPAHEVREYDQYGDPIAVRWEALRAFAAGQRGADAREFVEAAYAQPRLRALSPGRAMYWITFSRRAAPPICADLPRVRAHGGDRFAVHLADGRVHEGHGAAATVALVLQHLPEDAVPAPRGG
ncbi:DUF6193 family natural product biosynthesis protein [Streptomyces sp. TLI_171]|uniref:DUF6193 family natural product biosynthesis protein n=1 Tax=Streptomyces sp. TLI_171 TaxID=1938859 RepID=UPI000C190851|nr:DUF6193 family natural product biosynthesis protein [Streptomyces sp. TLI_171]RKE22530.1 hypothetical protein BX266_5976 [Streptomyces sp. TLI_171]